MLKVLVLKNRKKKGSKYSQENKKSREKVYLKLNNLADFRAIKNKL